MTPTRGVERRASAETKSAGKAAPAVVPPVNPWTSPSGMSKVKSPAPIGTKKAVESASPPAPAKKGDCLSSSSAEISARKTADSNNNDYGGGAAVSTSKSKLPDKAKGTPTGKKPWRIGAAKSYEKVFSKIPKKKSKK